MKAVSGGCNSSRAKNKQANSPEHLCRYDIRCLEIRRLSGGELRTGKDPFTRQFFQKPRFVQQRIKSMIDYGHISVNRK